VFYFPRLFYPHTKTFGVGIYWIFCLFYDRIVHMPKKKRIDNNSQEELPRKSHGKNPGWIQEIPEKTKQGILAIFLGALGLIFLISFFIPQGVLGSFVGDLMKTLFGWGKLFLPILLFVLSGFVAMQKETVMTRGQWIGFGVFLFSFFGFVHLFVGLPNAVALWGEEIGGGWVGLILSYPLQKMIGFWGAFVVLLALTVSSALVMFHASFEELRRAWEIIRGRFTGKDGHVFEKESFDEAPKEDNSEVFVTTDVDEESVRDDEETDGSLPEPKAKPARNKKSIAQLGMFPKSSKIRSELLFPVDLLSTILNNADGGDVENNKMRIQKTLENFGIKVEMGDVNVGPRVTQYTLKPSDGVKLSQITALSNDLALALAAHPLRIEAPIPGKSYAGIEVPNHVQSSVSLREILESDAFKKRKSNLVLALGKDVMGNPFLADLDKMPHLLIAGSTGSGKSVCLNTILLSLIAQNSPQECQLLLVDPKRVELVSYNDIPHLVTPVITDVNKTIHALRWTVGEMDRRFELFSKNQSRNIQSYNDQHPDEALPYLVVAIDELADLMAVAAKEVEGLIVRLAQMARATGIHLILATQRPSVDVLTGLIKANITSRIAFNVASGTDSRTILDTSGAEKLLGRGDMLFISAELSKPKRLQGVFVSDGDISKVTEHMCKLGRPDYQTSVIEGPTKSTEGFDLGSDDSLLSEAQDVVVRAGKASASLLQRRLRVGYSRAARLLDLLEEKGVVGPGDGAKPREVLLDASQLDHLKQADDLLAKNEPLNPEEKEDGDGIPVDNRKDSV